MKIYLKSYDKINEIIKKIQNYKAYEILCAIENIKPAYKLEDLIKELNKERRKLGMDKVGDKT